ncbi:MAG: potassium transporter TrkH [Planctomycetaceae bacterium]|nr:MAG: potassium transporter TrkH [Planctomycetaceae bacterium]
MFVGSFLLLIAVGTLGLKALPGLYVSSPLGWVDAAFTATSAVCVTGLIVTDTATHFTPLGQAYLLLLIQLGGLGMLAFTSLIIVALGKRLSLRAETLAHGIRDAAPNIDSKRLMLDVVRFTLALEALGAVTLFLLWGPKLGWSEAMWPAVFHSVSAFCNAGFSNFSDSMVGFQTAPATLLVVMILIILGGIGFLTMEETVLALGDLRGRTRFRMSLHSRLVLWTTAVLVVGGGILFVWFESESSLAGMKPIDRVCNGLFMSVTARTAGFNTVDYADVTDSGNFLTILLMMIGGSPGSTAGGLKTTTFALIGLLAWSRLRSQPATSFAGRSVPDETIQRAVGLMVVAVATVAVGMFVMARTEPLEDREGRFLIRMFEVVSAFNTVGLSMGLTSDLSTGGRLMLTLLMLLGRVGPLTLAAALILRRPRRGHFRYAYEDVVVG